MKFSVSVTFFVTGWDVANGRNMDRQTFLGKYHFRFQCSESNFTLMTSVNGASTVSSTFVRYLQAKGHSIYHA